LSVFSCQSTAFRFFLAACQLVRKQLTTEN
jgi:hypothetical protein